MDEPTAEPTHVSEGDDSSSRPIAMLKGRAFVGGKQFDRSGNDLGDAPDNLTMINDRCAIATNDNGSAYNGYPVSGG